MDKPLLLKLLLLVLLEEEEEQVVVQVQMNLLANKRFQERTR